MCVWAVFVAAAVAAAAAHKQANAENAVSEYQGRVAANNAKVAGWQAEDAKARGDLAASQNLRKYQQLQGTQTASLSARGLDISYGSPNAILTDTDYFGAYDENTIRANSRREAWGYQVQADNYMNQAQFLHDQRKANNPWQAGAWGFLKGLAGGMGGMGGGGAGGGSSGSYSYQGSEMPASLRGQNNYDSSMLTNQGLVSSRWYGSSSWTG